MVLIYEIQTEITIDWPVKLKTSQMISEMIKMHDPSSHNCAMFVSYTVTIVLSLTSRV